MAKEEMTLVPVDESNLMAMLGIDTSIQEADQHLAATVPMMARRTYKVDYTGKTRMADNRMGQFMPIPPGEQKGKILVGTLTVIPLEARFWGQKSEEVTVEKDGKDVTQMRTVCETERRPLLDEKGRAILDDTGTPIWMKNAEGNDVGYATDVGFGWAKTVERFQFRGTQYGDCSACAFVKDKLRNQLPESPCKARGSMTAAVFHHDGETVEAYIAEIPMNYTSTIAYRKMLDDVIKRKSEFPSARPQELVLRVGLVRNTMAANPFYELDFTPVMSTSQIEPKKLQALLGKAIEKYLADKKRIESERSEAPALAEPAAKGKADTSVLKF